MTDEPYNKELDNVNRELNDLKKELDWLIEQKDDLRFLMLQAQMYKQEYGALCEPLEPTVEECKQIYDESESKIQAVKQKIRYRENKLLSNRSDQMQPQQLSRSTISYLNKQEKREQAPLPNFNFISVNPVPPEQRSKYPQYQAMAGNTMQFIQNTCPSRKQRRINQNINAILKDALNVPVPKK